MRVSLLWCSLLLLTLLGMLSCGTEVRTASPVVEPPVAYVVPRAITMRSATTTAEEGVAVLLRITDARLGHPSGAVTRYPEDGAVLSFNETPSQVLAPGLLIQNDKAIGVEVMVIAVPNGISFEALEAINFAFTELAATLIPGGRLGLAVKYALSRTSDKAKSQLQAGRMLAYHQFMAPELGQSQVAVSDGIMLTVDQMAVVPGGLDVVPGEPTINISADTQYITLLEAYDLAYTAHNVDEIVSLFHSEVEVISTDNSVMTTTAELRAGFTDTLARKPNFKVVVGRDYIIEHNTVHRIVEISWREGKVTVRRIMRQDVVIESGKIRKLRNTMLREVRT
ncbi:MAG: hypothetical protein JST60_09260 [Chloroflexi bacterium SZAS-1]|nr:hypothetical protein [Chloroflexi bacterium SZAS-1]